jgi:acyl-CoA thioester hydrolase
MDAFDKVERTEDFRTLTKEDTRKFARVPKDLG